MRHLFVGLLFIMFGLVACKNAAKQSTKTAVAESMHSAGFNQSVQSAMDTYYDLTEAFVNWDSVKVSSLAATLNTKLDSLQLNAFKNDSLAKTTNADSVLAGAKKELAKMIAVKDIAAKRYALNAVSDDLFDLLNTVKYDRQKLYLQQCPMAFNDTGAGVWISRQEAIRNPYLGLHHPYYKSAMVECGETKKVVNFTAAK